MAKYKLKYMFEWGGICVWSDNEAARVLFGDYAIETEKLPISDSLKKTLVYLEKKHDEALNWDDPGGDLLWTQDQIDEFGKEAREAYQMLCDELGEEFDVTLFREDCI